MMIHFNTLLQQATTDAVENKKQYDSMVADAASAKFSHEKLIVDSAAVKGQFDSLVVENSKASMELAQTCG